MLTAPQLHLEIGYQQLLLSKMIKFVNKIVLTYREQCRCHRDSLNCPQAYLYFSTPGGYAGGRVDEC
jgi:hypothetical protein